jgi:glycine/serine hydroxymethyltransferase
MNAPLATVDPELADIVEREKARQRDSIVLIPSEVFYRLRRATFNGVNRTLRHAPSWKRWVP